MPTRSENFEPPNGGFGWVVVLGASLINVFNQSIVSVFGLMFGGFLSSLKESETRIALVMNACSAFLNLTGLITAPLIRNFTPRSITIFGSSLVSFGLMLSSITTTLPQVIFTYSFMVGSGLGLIIPSIFMAVSSFFTTKKSRAFGFALVGTSIGQMIMPLIVKALLNQFEFRGTVLIMGALALHGVLGASLFQPVEWHLKRKAINAIEEPNETQPLLPSSSECTSSSTSSYQAPDYSDQGFWRRLAKSLDLSLLKDIRFVILNFGLGSVYTVSIDFALILPFFLQQEAQLDKTQTAICMSVLAAFDLISRLTFHLFTDKLNLSHRSIFMVGTLTLGVVRSIMAEMSDYKSLIIVCAFFGYCRALTVVNQVLTVSEYCTKHCPEKLPGALGLNMLIKGFSVITLGQLLGYVRDITQSYNMSLHSQNILLSIAMIVWTIELAWYRRS